MSIDKIIKSRKSTFPKDFSGDSITRAELEELLSVVPFTPNHKRTQPWRFQVFQDQAKLALGSTLAKLYKQYTPPDSFLEKKFVSIQTKFELSSAVLAIVIKKSGLVPEWEEVAAVAMSVQNLWLKATEMGIGGYWSSPSLIQHMGEFLTLNEDEQCLGFFYLGKVQVPFMERTVDWEEFVEFQE